MSPLFDAHCHLQLPPIRDQWPEVRASLRDCGLAACVVNATGEDDWHLVRRLARGHDWILPSYGLHPRRLASASDGWLGRLESLLAEAPCGVGEIGLDRRPGAPGLDRQRDALAAQLELARRHRRPASIHCGRAWGPLVELLESLPLPDCGVLLHGFSGSREIMRRVEALGGYFAFNAVLLRPERARAREVFREVPPERLLIESDAPSMPPPAGFRPHADGDWSGHNHPANIAAAYRGLAEFLGRDERGLRRLCARNFARLFAAAGGIDEHAH